MLPRAYYQLLVANSLVLLENDFISERLETNKIREKGFAAQ